MPPVLFVAKAIVLVLDPLQTTSPDGWLTCAVGLTVMVKVFDDPEQILPPLLNPGVTLIVDVTGVVPEFTAVKELMSPVPVAGSPIEVLVLVQL
jgi:hypothetical protein